MRTHVSMPRRPNGSRLSRRAPRASSSSSPRNVPSLSGAIELAVHTNAHVPTIHTGRVFDPAWLVRFLIESRYLHAAIYDGIEHGPFQTFRHLRGIRVTFVQEIDLDLKRWIVENEVEIAHPDRTPGWDYATQMEPWVYDHPALFLTHAYYLLFLYGTVGKKTMQRLEQAYGLSHFNGFNGPGRGALDRFRAAYETTARDWSSETVDACFETLELATKRSTDVFQLLDEGFEPPESDADADADDDDTSRTSAWVS